MNGPQDWVRLPLAQGNCSRVTKTQTIRTCKSAWIWQEASRSCCRVASRFGQQHLTSRVTFSTIFTQPRGYTFCSTLLIANLGYVSKWYITDERANANQVTSISPHCIPFFTPLPFKLLFKSNSGNSVATLRRLPSRCVRLGHRGATKHCEARKALAMETVRDCNEKHVPHQHTTSIQHITWTTGIHNVGWCVLMYLLIKSNKHNIVKRCKTVKR